MFLNQVGTAEMKTWRRLDQKSDLRLRPRNCNLTLAHKIIPPADVRSEIERVILLLCVFVQCSLLDFARTLR